MSRSEPIGDNVDTPEEHMIDFGCDNPRQMPRHLFDRAIRINYDTAVKSDPQKQNCSICPRYWYVDAIFECQRCGDEFTFTAAEQRVWYEEYGFWIDSLPKHCLTCRRDLRLLKTIRQEYDRSVLETLEHGNLDSKKRLAGIIDQLYELGGDHLPARINENRRRLAHAIARAAKGEP